MHIKAKIYRPTKTSMQAGRKNTKHWVLEFEPATKQSPDPLMGWNSGTTLEQIRLEFDSQDAAVAHAGKLGVEYEVIEPKERIIKPKAYASNFAFARRTPFGQ